MIERIILGWHNPKLWGHLTSVIAKVNENSRSQITLSRSYVATSGKLREKSSVLSRRSKVDREQTTERSSTECSRLVQLRSQKRGRRQWTGSTSERLTCPTTMTVVAVFICWNWLLQLAFFFTLLCKGIHRHKAISALLFTQICMHWLVSFLESVSLNMQRLARDKVDFGPWLNINAT